MNKENGAPVGNHDALGTRPLEARIAEVLNRWPAVGLAVGVIRNGSLEFFHGHGLADIPSRTAITEDTVFSDRLHH